MNVCQRSECQTSAGCAHRGPMGQMCYFPLPADRNYVIEECARVADSYEEAEFGYDPTAVKIAASIRALKDKP